MKENNPQSPKMSISIVFSIIIVFGLFIGFWMLNRYWYSIPPTAAEFGDSFGAVNALFSALAFAGIIITILLQRKELALQREELANTRLELKKSAEAQEASQKALNWQVSFMAKQTLLSSYKTMHDYEVKKLGSSIPKVRGEAGKNMSVFFSKMEKLLIEIEHEKLFFDNPDIKNEIEDFKKDKSI